MGKRSSPLVVTVGIATIDYTLAVPEFGRTQGTVVGGPMRDTLGGPAALAAAAVCRLGGRAACLTRVGTDLEGDLVIKRLRGAGVDPRAVRRVPGAATTSAFLFVDAESGERRAFVVPGNCLHIAGDAGPLPAGLVDRADALFLDDWWLSCGREAALRAKERGALVVVESNRITPDHEPLLRLVDVLVISRRGAEEIAGRADYDRPLFDLRARGARTVMVTLGASGCGWLGPGDRRPVWRDAFPVRAVNTNGAGSCFRGALALALARGWEMPRAAEFASAVGALVSAKWGRLGLPAIPTEAEVAAFLTWRKRDARHLAAGKGRETSAAPAARRPLTIDHPVGVHSGSARLLTEIPVPDLRPPDKPAGPAVSAHSAPLRTPRTLRILCVGSARIDYVFPYRRSDPSRALQVCDTLSQQVGGTAALAALRCAQKGSRTTLWTRLGRDVDGRVVSGLLAEAGVGVPSRPLAKDRTTTVGLVPLDEESGDGAVYLYPGSCLAASDLDRSWTADAAKADAILFDEGWHSAALAAILRVRETSVRSRKRKSEISNLKSPIPVIAAFERVSPEIDDLLEYADVLLLPRFGFAWMTAGRPEEEVLRDLRAQGPGAVVILEGRGVCRVDDGGGLPAVISSPGAPRRPWAEELGTFAGALARGLAAGLDLRTACREALESG